MKRLTLLPLLAVVLAAGLFGQHNLRAAEPPRFGLPPEEKKPTKVFQSVAADSGPDWGVVMVNAPKAWEVTKGKGVKVAVLDTGSSLTHPDLKESFADAKDFTRSKTGVVDVQGHATHVAGTIGARGPLPGVAPECTLYAAKVLDDSGSGGVDEIAAGIRHAAKVWEVDIINMSLGGPTADDWIPPALDEAVKAGVIVIVAAGNSGPAENTEGYPGGYAQSISVAACDKLRNVAEYSSRGKNVFVTGPGTDIRSTWPGGQYATISGTSMAAPHVAGIAALWVAAHPEVKKVDRPAAFRAALRGSTKFTDRTTARGYGLADAVLTVGKKGAPPKPPETKVYRVDLSKLQAEGYTSVELVFGATANSLPAATPPASSTVPPVPVGPQSFGPTQPPGVCPPGGIPAVIAPQFQPVPQYMPQQQACPAGGCQPRPTLFPRLFR